MTDNLQSQHPAAFQVLRLSKYLFRFGPVRGPGAYLRLSLARHDPVTISVPGVGGTVHVRRHTSDVATFEKIFLSREYDLSFLGIQPRTILDLGANVGYASVYFASKYPDARIIAVEPEPTNYGILKANTARFPNVECVNAAIWPTPASMAIANPDAEAWAFVVQETGSAVPGDASIRGMTVDQLMQEHSVPHIDVMKIDIEGAEKELFRPGCESWLQHVAVLITELHDWMIPGCGTAFFRATSQFDFRYFNVGENTVIVRDSIG